MNVNTEEVHLVSDYCQIDLAKLLFRVDVFWRLFLTWTGILTDLVMD